MSRPNPARRSGPAGVGETYEDQSDDSSEVSVRYPDHVAATNGSPRDTIFDRVLVGVDDTPESIVAAAQARALRAHGGHLSIVAVAETYLAAHAGAAVPRAERTVEAETSAALEQACGVAEPDERRLTTGRLVEVLREECRRGAATLVVVGARPHRRLTAAAFGGHDVELLRESTCPLLVARPGWGPSRPARVVVGVDGSPASREAEAVARALAARLECELVPVVPLGTHPEPELLRSEGTDVVLQPGSLVDAVGQACDDRTLVVLAHGPDSEKLAYAVRCSVLVVPGS